MAIFVGSGVTSKARSLSQAVIYDEKKRYCCKIRPHFQGKTKANIYQIPPNSALGICCQQLLLGERFLSFPPRFSRACFQVSHPAAWSFHKTRSLIPKDTQSLHPSPRRSLSRAVRNEALRMRRCLDDLILEFGSECAPLPTHGMRLVPCSFSAIHAWPA